MVSGSVDWLFALSQDYSRRQEWDPFAARSELLNGATVPAVGVDEYIESVGGLVMVSRYVSFQPPHVAAVSMIEGPRLLAGFSGGWKFRQISPTLCTVTFTYNFRTSPIWLRWAMEPIAGLWYKRQMRARLNGFKAWTETDSKK
ncbi:Polyketide cyclase / dehydrase and lipid transport [Paraburkholderia susongensis]|uniref:Polyketide cyclase / dehydrase and lipid transport n=2 Tax=Paraburkholderia susongensis TaxID=1515439 RepID=A0A1X7KEZ8_9BURK|nr:Polyketide cyclase / dehydrase and lipid transport [Paraburkholderia susongensis]